MKPNRSAQSKRLSHYVDTAQSKGRITFTGAEALKELGISRIAFNRSAERLIEKKRLIHPARGFYVIVPVEYVATGAPPPSWFIDALMNFHGQPYYVGVLTAAALHGAAHQSPQEFQVVTNAPLSPFALPTAIFRRHRPRAATSRSHRPRGRRDQKVSRPLAR